MMKKLGQQYKTITKVVIKNTIKPTNMSMWFWKMPLKSIEGIEKIDTSNCTNMYGLFQFANNTTITSLDLSSWDTAKVKNMMNMFYGDSKLKTIYASNQFVINSALLDQDMFYNCTALIGENGTRYNSSKVGKEYARIDEEGVPGYFTSK